MYNFSAFARLLHAICAICAISVGYIFTFSTVAFAHQTSIKLFNATPTFSTGEPTSPADAVLFSGISLELEFGPNDTARLSSTPDGNGPLVIDNFIAINGVNACEGLSTAHTESCFRDFLMDPLSPEVVGMPIDAVLSSVNAFPVTKFIPIGKSTLTFDIRDFGVIAGNTDIFLVTTGTVTQVQSTTARAFDASLNLAIGQLNPALVTAFQVAFNKQVRNPIIKTLEQINSDSNVINRVRQQLRRASIELSREAATAITSQMNNQTLLSELQRTTETVFSETANSPTVIRQFSTEIGEPTIRIRQSIEDIVANGFDTGRVEYDWENISAEFVLGQSGFPGPVFAPNLNLTAEVAAKIGLDGNKEISAKVGGELSGKSVKLTLAAEGTVKQSGGQPQGGAEIKVTLTIGKK